MSIFRPEDEAQVRDLLDALERPVELLVALGPEETPLPGARDVDFGAETQRVVAGLAELSERVTYRVEDQPDGFERYPAIAVLPEGEDVGLRYYGLPWGYELGSLIGAGDVGAAIVWLCSAGAAHVTGAVIPVDAGFTTR